MNQGMIENVIDALTAKNRTVSGWDTPVSLCDLGYCMVGIDEGWEGCGVTRVGFETRAVPQSTPRPAYLTYACVHP